MTATAPDDRASLFTAILAIEQRDWPGRGAKAEAVSGLGLTETRYYQLLNQLIDTPDAYKAAPVLVSRLRRRRDARLALRAGRSGP